MNNPNILLVEDDAELAKLVSGRLRDSGYDIRVVGSGPDAVDAVQAQLPDLLLLDVMLPGFDGLEVCRRVRAQHPLLYIVMLTARTDEIDRIVGLEVGADDYITKPFSLQELVARVRSILRRIRLTQESGGGNTFPKVTPNELLQFDGLHLDVTRREVRKDGQLLHLTVREFDLLLFLMQNPDRPFTRGQLLEKVWDIRYEGYDRTVDSHVQRLRTKIERDSENPRYVRTVWGLGYKFQSKDEE
ncbi:MAG: response regulator transcription factor [Bacteroidetes Order II. Incertae sedis bacterium]|nr:response regulator transcription factor [Bacteroidetes Order II. bacterium]